MPAAAAPGLGGMIMDFPLVGKYPGQGPGVLSHKRNKTRIVTL